MFKQFMQTGAMQYCQVDSCRLGGLNEVLAVLLLAAKLGGQLQNVFCFIIFSVYHFVISFGLKFA